MAVAKTSYEPGSGKRRHTLLPFTTVPSLKVHLTVTGSVFGSTTEAANANVVSCAMPKVALAAIVISGAWLPGFVIGSLSSQPVDPNAIERQIVQLEIERQALSKEEDLASKERLKAKLTTPPRQ